MTDRTACPSCRSRGEDASGDNVKLYEDKKGGYCFKCREYFPIKKLIMGGDLNESFNTSGERKQFYPRGQVDSSGELSAISRYPIRAWEERGISKETMERFNVRCTIDEVTGKPDAFFFPYFDHDGNITGYKKRKTGAKEFSVIGKIKGLFGQHQAKQNAQFVVIVEGEIDQLSVAEMFRQQGKDWVVVSIPNGANEEGILDPNIKKEIEWITKHPKIALALDMDKPGQETGKSIADLLVSRCTVRIVQMPVKDANEMLKRGMVEDFFKCLSQAKEHKPNQIILGNDGTLEKLLTPVPQGLMFPFLPRTCAKLDGFRTRELTTIVANVNVGKSSLARQMLYYELKTTKNNVGGFFLEETHEKTRQSIIAYHAGVPLGKYRKDPSIADKLKVEEAWDDLLPRLFLFKDDRRVITDDVIERKIEYFRQAQGCLSVYFDHLSFVISGREGGDERRAVDNLMTKLARSVEALDYRMFIVSHIKRGGKEESRTQKNQKYPFWEIVDVHQARSSGAIEQLSHNMLALEKQVLDPEEDNTRGQLRTRILRAREHGIVGLGDYLEMDETGMFIPIQTEY